MAEQELKNETKASEPKPLDDEIAGLYQISAALEGKDRETCARMLDWAASVFTNCVLMPGCVRGRDFPPQERSDG